MLTIVSARELPADRVRVNAVAQGTVGTDLTRSIAPNPEALKRAARELTPLGRLGEASEIASAVEFLSSEDASYMTGHVLVVDGGWLT